MDRIPVESPPTPEPQFGNATRSAAAPSRSSALAAARKAPEFRGLRRRTLWFIAPVGVLSFAWYMAYAVLGGYARAWLAEPVFGLVNIGMLLGLAQFVTTALVTVAWVRYQARWLEPQAAAVRAAGGEYQ